MISIKRKIYRFCCAAPVNYNEHMHDVINFFSQLFEALIDGFVPPQLEPDIPKGLLKSALRIALRQFELDKRDRLLNKSDYVSRLNTVISKMPMPFMPKRISFASHTNKDLFYDKFSDIFEEDSDESSPELSDQTRDYQSLLDNSAKHLTLKKSSRHNLFSGSRNRRSYQGSLSDPSGGSMNFDEALCGGLQTKMSCQEPQNPDKVRQQVLFELHHILDSMEGTLVSAPTRYCRRSTRCRKVSFDISDSNV